MSGFLPRLTPELDGYPEVMLREIASLPAAPVRLLDDVGALRKLVRELLQTEDRLSATAESMDRKLETANRRLEQALEELRGSHARLHRLDTRIEQLDREVRAVRAATDEIKEVVPDLGRGPLEKAKDALTGG